MYRQARWDEPLIYELSKKGKIAVKYAAPDVPEYDVNKFNMRRKNSADLPEVSEMDVVRHVHRLSQMCYGVDTGTYPLGSCTMKLNPKVNEAIARFESTLYVHPDQPEKTIQGSLELMYEHQQALAEISGLPAVTLQPPAGAAGEYTGVKIIKAYHISKGDTERDEMLIPDAAHGTNPASAAMAGFKIVTIPSNSIGQVDVEALRAATGPKTAGLMITNPNTLGLFEEQIEEIAKIVHEAGGLLYYDGANFNAICGKIRPGDMGFDVLHFNLHKTFATPHGGGGPGSGPVAVRDYLAEFLPVPVVIKKDDGSFGLLWDLPKTIGKVHGYFGNFGVVVKAHAYLLSLGPIGLRQVTEQAVLNANYAMKRMVEIDGLDLDHDTKQPRKHEFVVSAERLKRDTGIDALKIAKGMISKGIHAPTVYFPLIVHEALMVEPTESESKAALDAAVDLIAEVIKEMKENPELQTQMPIDTSIGPLDEVIGARRPVLSWQMLQALKE